MAPATAPPKLTKGERALLGRRFVAWKIEHGIGSGSPISHPSFRVALARLVNDHGYSLTDIAVFLGVTKECVRLWLNRARIPYRPRGQMRVWDDDQNRFVTVANRAEYKRLERERSSPLGPLSKPEKRRRIARWVIRDLAEDLGRVPCHVDLADAFCVTPPSLNSMLGFHRRAGTISARCDALWRAAGFASRPRDRRVHRHRVDPALVEWATSRLKITKAELVERAVVDFITRLMKEAA